MIKPLSLLFVTYHVQFSLLFTLHRKTSKSDSEKQNLKQTQETNPVPKAKLNNHFSRRKTNFIILELVAEEKGFMIKNNHLASKI